MVCLGYFCFFSQASSTRQHGTEPWFSEEHGVLFVRCSSHAISTCILCVGRTAGVD